MAATKRFIQQYVLQPQPAVSSGIIDTELVQEVAIPEGIKPYRVGFYVGQEQVPAPAQCTAGLSTTSSQDFVYFLPFTNNLNTPVIFQAQYGDYITDTFYLSSLQALGLCYVYVVWEVYV